MNEERERTIAEAAARVAARSLDLPWRVDARNPSRRVRLRRPLFRLSGAAFRDSLVIGPVFFALFCTALFWLLSFRDDATNFPAWWTWPLIGVAAGIPVMLVYMGYFGFGRPARVDLDVAAEEIWIRRRGFRRRLRFADVARLAIRQKMRMGGGSVNAPVPVPWRRVMLEAVLRGSSRRALLVDSAERGSIEQAEQDLRAIGQLLAVVLEVPLDAPREDG